MKKLYSLLIACIGLTAYAQVGIGTAIPAADLEIIAKPLPLATGEHNGIIIPKVVALPTVVAPSGTIVF